jgi:5'(3')-deoxyribonucleotidase
MSRERKTIFIDMDEVCADFSGSKDLKVVRYNPPEMYGPGFFLNLDVKEGAQRAVQQLLRDGFDVHILTQPVAMSPISYTEKVQWVMKHFPSLSNKINMTQDKGLFVGEYLIDDSLKWKEPFEKNGGVFIHFDLSIPSEQMWDNVYEFIFNKEKEDYEHNSKTTTGV